MKKGYILLFLVMILGKCSPTQETLYRSNEFTVYNDKVVQGEFQAAAMSPTHIVSNYKSPKCDDNNPVEWKLRSKIDHYPQLSCDQLLLESLYNMTLDETALLSEKDGTFRTGEKWPGVWTRDISYSIILGMGLIDPQRAITSLKKKVKRDRIIQDTGSGGSWPVSTDRVIWSLAAWELYCITGDNEWLNFAYPVIRNSVLDDREVIFDSVTKLVRGESSFLDWREQTYPAWMQNADIYQSFNLGTNIVHYQTYSILSEMAGLLGKTDDKQLFTKWGEQLKTAINQHFWDEERGYYVQYLYGRDHMVASPKSETLGEALAILYDVASKEQALRIMSSMPVLEWGTPCVYPQIPEIEPYHNNGIWPFVQSFWNLAAAKTGDEHALKYGLACINRAAALFLTNKENMVADDGDFITVLNSNRQLWSVAGNLGMTFKVLLGLDIDQYGVLHFNPSVPENYSGIRELTKLVLRDTKLSIQVSGFGNIIKSFKVNGNPEANHSIDLTNGGNHKIEIELANNSFKKTTSMNLVNNKFHLATPKVWIEKKYMVWEEINDIIEYEIFADGISVAKTTKTFFPVETGKEYMVRAVDKDDNYSFFSEPVLAAKTQVVSLKQFAKNKSVDIPGMKSMVQLTKTKNTCLCFDVETETAGDHIIYFSYANGSGPWNTDNKCAVRMLFVNGKSAGAIVMPQRGRNKWDQIGYTNHVRANLNAGKNKLELVFKPYNENMNFNVNTALLGDIYYYRD